MSEQAVPAFMLERRYYDRQGNPISMQEALDRGLLADGASRVAEDTVGPYWISTVHLLRDHRLGHGSRPVIFETMVFANDTDPLGLDQDCERYCTEDEAKAGHARALATIRDGLDALGVTP